MFKKTNRLTTAEFNHFYKIGKKHHTKHLGFVVAKHNTLKVAVVVGKKVAKSAVRRNTIKRRIMSALRNSVEGETGVFIILVKTSFNTLPRKTAESFLRASIADLTKSK